MKLSKVFLVIAIVILAFAYRLIPNVPNFSPLLAVFLFAGTVMKNNWKGLLAIAGLYLVSDFILNNTIYSSFFPDQEGVIWFSNYMIFTLTSYCIVFGLGKLYGKPNSVLNIAGLSIGSSLIFFILTNTGAWIFDPFHIYPNNIAGLVASLAAGVPFFQTSLFADLAFAGVFFAIFHAVKSRIPELGAVVAK